jgi:hypothetical protein
VPPLELGKQAALHLRTVALGVEDGETGLPFWIVRRQMHQHANAPHALALLRARAERGQKTEGAAAAPSSVMNSRRFR